MMMMMMMMMMVMRMTMTMMMIISFKAAISMCKKGRQRQQIAPLLDEMANEKLAARRDQLQRGHC
eukprot:12407278-Karenia_brevis.AAC.1